MRVQVPPIVRRDRKQICCRFTSSRRDVEWELVKSQVAAELYTCMRLHGIRRCTVDVVFHSDSGTRHWLVTVNYPARHGDAVRESAQNAMTHVLRRMFIVVEPTYSAD